MLIKNIARLIYYSFMKLIKEEQGKDENEVTIKAETINHCIQQCNIEKTLTHTHKHTELNYEFGTRKNKIFV